MLSRIPTPDHHLTRHGWHRHPLRPNQHPMLFRRPWRWSICLKSGAQGSLSKFARRPDLYLWGLRIHLEASKQLHYEKKGNEEKNYRLVFSFEDEAQMNPKRATVLLAKCKA